MRPTTKQHFVELVQMENQMIDVEERVAGLRKEVEEARSRVHSLEADRG